MSPEAENQSLNQNKQKQIKNNKNIKSVHKKGPQQGEGEVYTSPEAENHLSIKTNKNK